MYNFYNSGYCVTVTEVSVCQCHESCSLYTAQQHVSVSISFFVVPLDSEKSGYIIDGAGSS
jgi:hypothetical protein